MQPSQIRVTQGGRLILPRSLRQELGIEDGQWLDIQVIDGHIRLHTRAQALQNAKALVQRYAPKSTSLAKQLIAERRKEAKRELTSSATKIDD